MYVSLDFVYVVINMIIRIRIRMSFIGQVCYTYEEFVIVTKLHSATDDSNGTGHRQQKNNIQIGNVQNSKNTMQYRQSCVSRSDVQI